MPYSLGQNPVPVWAAPEQEKIVKIKPEELPSFLFPKEAASRRNSDGPHFLKYNGRWNSMRNYKQDIDSASTKETSEEIDPTLLDVYDLNTKWKNRMDFDTERGGRLPSLQAVRDSVIKNLGSNPYFPIFLRGSATMFSVITLGLSCEVFVSTKNYTNNWTIFENNDLIAPDGPASSTIFTIVISCLSIVYSAFMLWDETFGQPLGLRPSHTKIKYVFFDLMLLCLQAGNSAASFDTLIDRKWVCPPGIHIRICSLHKAVISFILITSVVHCVSFLVSAFRMIHRATH